MDKEAEYNLAPQAYNPDLTAEFDPVEIERGEQPWATIYLNDGNKLRITVTVASIHRHKTKVGPDGMPEYCVAAAIHTQAFPRKNQK